MTKPRLAPFSLRLERDERAVLERNAGSLSLGAYIKSVLFAGDVPKHRTRGKAPVKDHTALGEVLARLGASRMASNLNQLAHAANSGTLYVDDHIKDDLNRASGDIRAIRLLIMRALGLVADNEIKGPGEQPTPEFAQAAADPPTPAADTAPKRFRL